jgi:hypothetical protein
MGKDYFKNTIEFLKKMQTPQKYTMEIEVDEDRKPTNFDKITESVESLAKFIDCRVGGNCDNCPVNYDEDCREPVCVDNIRKWLQKECEE